MNINYLIPLYVLIFDDKTLYKGGNDVYNTKWLDIPKKKIKQLIYRLPTGDHLIMTDYDSYYHFSEAITSLNRKEKNKSQLEYVYLLGARKNQTLCYKINIKSGIIETKTYNNKDKFIKELNPIGWK